MHVFMIAAEETSFSRWTEAFPGAVVLRPPFDELPTSGVEIFWVSVSLDNWLALVRDRATHARVVVHSRNPSDDEAVRALDAGAHGYCHSLSNVNLLRAVASTVAAGSLWVGPAVVARMIRNLRHALGAAPEIAPEGFETLTVREREVALAVTTGASNKEIAGQLGMTERTVKMHLGAVFKKLGVRDRVHLVLRLAAPVSDIPRH